MDSPPGIFSSDDGSEVTSPASVIDWMINYYKETKAKDAYRPIEGICKTGEVIFVPNGSDGITYNLQSVLRFMKDKPEQISGFKFGEKIGNQCCDEEREKPYETFVTMLKDMIWD
ncbi:hypothetical protein HK098_002726 [Nowakowskiella sp. JEL0407]|nr:hypothetical protein HK098_002726 [Nowakowskiella sp. JEL0407]